TVGLAIGVSGLTALEDYIGDHDIYGTELKVTQVAAADELAAGASLVMGQTTERVPLVLIRGYQRRANPEAEAQGVKPLIRPKQMDMFR
ncbi:MAG: coenzyme F420-0:L-glutamate ligase, partial [Pseudomonadales bacterium]